MKIVVAYDIADDKNRNKLTQLLSSYGYRYQYSVFYIPDIHLKEVEKLINRIKRFVNPKTDRVRIYEISKLKLVEGYIYEPWENFRVF
jgi:CRISPR-associated protein Cas2